ncbi:MAG: DUF4912 domain-containing protein [bacterium]
MNKEDLKKLTKAKLLGLAREQGLKGISKLKKEELAGLLLKEKTSKKPEEKASESAPTVKAAVTPPTSGRYEALAKWQEEIINSKYDSFLPGSDDLVSEQTGEDFPEASIDKAVLMIQDPFHLYLYWNISSANLSSRPVVRVYEETGRFFEVEFTGTGCYIQIPQATRTYYAQIGLIGEDESFKVLARSNTVQTPPAGREENRSGLSGKQLDRAYEPAGSSSWGQAPENRFESEWASRALGSLVR